MKDWRKRPQYIHLVRSCLTGKVVWVYRGKSETGMRLAYWRACKAEVKMVMMWMQQVNERRRCIDKQIKECLAKLPDPNNLNPKQRAALKRMEKIRDTPEPCYRGFYDHIMEEIRRKNEASARWRDQRNMWLGRKPKTKENTDYDK